MLRKVSAIVLLISLLFFVISCGQVARESGNLTENQDTPVESEKSENDADLENEDVDSHKNEEETEEESNEDESNKEEKPVVDLKALKVNELGKIMVLMYHDIGEEEDVWVRTPENFRKDLQVLYEKGYRAISMKDYLNGNINTPPGTTPVVLTFDDGTKGQFNILEEEGEFVVDPNCAVGILEDFYQQHPDFGLEATFYIYYPNPFRQKNLIEQKMKYIIEKGMDIGNHSYNHDNLKKDMKTKQARDAAFIQESLAKNIIATNEILPGYEVDSLALPYGEKPQGDLYNYVVKGSYEGVEYHHKGVLLVGSNPAQSPYHVKADMANIPRVRASEIETYNTGLYDWLDYFDKHPEERYISDGDPNTISFPKELESDLNLDSVKGKIVQAYE